MQNNSSSSQTINTFVNPWYQRSYSFIIKKIDRFINNLTMYKLTLYGLMSISLYAILISILGIFDIVNFPFNPLSLIASFFVLNIAAHFSNLLFSKIFNAPLNAESAYITAFILFLIMPPIGSFSFVGKFESFLILVFSAFISMVSKYIFAIHKKHIFNPAATGALITGFIFTNGQATWWVGSLALIVPTAILGFLIVRKIHRARLFFSFLITSILTLIIVAISKNTLISSVSGGNTSLIDPLASQFVQNLQAVPYFIWQLLISWPLVFFATIMLTEPLTTPPTKKLQGWYGAIVGFIFGMPLHAGVLYMSPQLALVLGNLFTYFVSPKQRLVLALKNKKEVAANIFHFTFKTTEPLKFKPGQYIEWTLPHEEADSRGNRRYFTVASSPTESDIAIGVKIITDKSSSFKHELLNLEENNPKSIIVASQVSGDFTLPEDKSIPLVFIAGGIGVTPFRSILKYLIDNNQRRDIILFYACTNDKEFAYTDIFTEAEKVGVKFIPVITNKEAVPSTWSAGPLQGQVWQGVSGFLNKDIIESKVPNYKNRTYYLSGPGAMVDSYKSMLKNIGIQNKQIKTDYFPGF